MSASLHLPTQLDPAIEARMLVAQAGGTRVSRGWTIGATADICGLDHEPSRPPTPHRTRPEGHPAMNTEPRTWNPGDSLILPPADNDNGDHQLDPPPANYADPKDTQP